MFRCLRKLLPELAGKLERGGLPRERMRAFTMGGDILYDHAFGPFDQKSSLADSNGCRIAWAEAMRIMRTECSSIQYRTEVVEYKVRGGHTILVFRDLTTGSQYESEYDLVIATDGRYSKLREQCTGVPQPNFQGVANFRILIPDTSKGLHDDLMLMYNMKPNVSSIPENFRSPDVEYCFSASTRLAAMKTKFANKPHIYVFGNFPVRHEIPDQCKSPQVLRALFTPTNGVMSKASHFILERVCARASELHWARFQDTPPYFHSDDHRVLFIGDAARAFCPSLGQGAGSAIESACMAAVEITKALGAVRRQLLKKGQPLNARIVAEALRAVTNLIATKMHERVEYIAYCSDQNALHCNPESGLSAEEEVRRWAELDPKHKTQYQRLWRDYTRHDNFNDLVEREFLQSEDDSESHGVSETYTLTIQKTLYAIRSNL